MFDVAAFRAEFAFFAENPQWVYLDNAATTHKPQAVISAMSEFYQRHNSNVHRAAHRLSQRATAEFEQARMDIAQFLNAKKALEIIWTSGATAAFNQLVFGMIGPILQPGDSVLLTALEHHANIVPWQFHAQPFGVQLQVVPLDARNHLDIAAFEQLLTTRPKVVSFTHVSNALGHVSPIKTLIQLAKRAGAITIVDGSQGISFEKVDVQALDCDFYICSGHKLYGPTGIGVLYGKETWLAQLKPLFYGGEMIKQVSFAHTTLNELPYRLEAGTPNIAGAIGFAAAVRWLSQYDSTAMTAHKQQLLQRLLAGLQTMTAIEVLSTADNNAGIISLNMRDEHPSDLAVLLDQQHIAVRAGTHCAMPLFQALKRTGAVRLSLAPYNTAAEIDFCLAAIQQSVELLA